MAGGLRRQELLGQEQGQHSLSIANAWNSQTTVG